MNNWLIVGSSAIGANHLKNNSPCQDYYASKIDKNGYGIAVISDGAGSAMHADIGSQLIVKEVITVFTNLFLKNINYQSNLPDANTWQTIATQNLKIVRDNLEKFCRARQLDFSQMAATVMVLIFSPKQLLISHIGDGRGAYQNLAGEWKSLFTPYKGEYANETVFLTSDIWQETDKYIDSQVINEPIQAFALLSDGMERHSFVCSTWDEEQKKYLDPNLPFAGFFNPLVKHLSDMKKAKVPETEIQQKWAKFIAEGNEKIKNEPDDKTMILGVLLDK